MLAKGKGSNAGFGTWLARDSATQDIIARAALALDEELAKMQNEGAAGPPSGR